MELGFFAMPAHPPERDLKQAFDWNVDVIRWLDEFGFAEAWIGEHHAVPWEPIPAPDLIMAQAFRETKNIRLGPGGFILPMHHPIQIADRLALLDHVSGGRVNFGVATGSIPSDWTSFNYDPAVLRDMARECLDIISRWWTEDAPWTYSGKFWKVTKPEKMYDLFWHHLKPVQSPHPPIGMAGISPGSSTLTTCGERGFYPMSLAFNNSYLASHWEAVEAGAATTGRKADRKDWRIARQILVADTDAEAMKLAIEGGMGYFEVNYDLKLLKALGVIDLIKSDKDMPDSDLTAEHMARHNWIVGSPQTVAEKIEEMNAATGGFGTLMVLGYDYIDQPEAWRHSLELLAKEVMPRIEKL
jgi:alkanesulfonate monooxygenase SsuD/methylene tetrahydromethanopterin reductase-like flavin-dependent oxidoreductase (luciferase family)